MSIPKKNIQQFYIDLLTQFPVMKKLPTWSQYKWASEGYQHALVMSDIAEELEAWIRNDKLKRAQGFLDFIDNAFERYNEYVTGYIDTDFLVTVMEFEKEYRETCKGMMKAKTVSRYIILLRGYQELDT